MVSTNEDHADDRFIDNYEKQTIGNTREFDYYVYNNKDAILDKLSRNNSLNKMLDEDNNTKTSTNNKHVN